MGSCDFDMAIYKIKWDVFQMCASTSTAPPQSLPYVVSGPLTLLSSSYPCSFDNVPMHAAA